ncbi:MAG: hypothetical protein M9894_35240 [Planctomycetes bacterium]|nr:hypothetical protein [Planctomycetota bacterium]
MSEHDLGALRRAAIASGDPAAVCRWRLAASRAGEELWPVPGDLVMLEAGAVVRVVRVDEMAGGPPRVVALAEAPLALPAAGWRVVGPHRPAVLLSEEELARRLQEDLPDAAGPRGVETLLELARRGAREAVDVALDLLPRLDDAREDVEPLRAALSALLRGRPPGEVEVALLRRPREARDALELPALAASAPDPAAARDVLDRLAALPPADAARAARRAGRWLVGAGGPAFATAEARAEVARLAREHPDLGVRRALFAHAAAPLVPEALAAAALGSADPAVRAAAARVLLRRGAGAPVWARVAAEGDLGVLAVALEEAPGAPPAAAIERALACAADRADGADLERVALARVAELDASEALPLLAPWLDGGRGRGLAEAALTAGLLGETGAPAAEALLDRARADEALQPVVLEALARLAPGLADAALDAWGADLLRAGPWAEEAALTAGLLLGRGVEPGELLGRLALAPPRGLLRRARLLDAAAAATTAADRALGARLTRGLPPSPPARFRALLRAPAGA